VWTSLATLPRRAELAAPPGWVERVCGVRLAGLLDRAQRPAATA
jgi:hypothetical protein